MAGGVYHDEGDVQMSYGLGRFGHTGGGGGSGGGHFNTTGGGGNGGGGGGSGDQRGRGRGPGLGDFFLMTNQFKYDA